MTVVICSGLGVILYVFTDPHIKGERASLKKVLWLFNAVGLSLLAWGEAIYFGIKITFGI